MKRIVSIIVACVMMVTLAVFSTSCNVNDTVENLEGDYTGLEGTTLNVMNWGQYISDGSEGSLNVIKAFEKATGIKVNYNDSTPNNESMYAKLKSGSVAVDVVIPSDYMIERMIKEDMLQKIDKSKVTNYKYILDEYKDLFFDPTNEYSVPYNVGMVGIIYNTTMVEGTPDSWSILWDETYKDNILSFNNPRDAFATAQFLLGQDVNNTDKALWDAAAEKLKEQNSILQGRVMDEVFNKMEGGNAAIAPYYAGDFLLMQSNNEDLAFVYPKEGTNIFVDSMVIPKNAKNYEAALMFINFMLEPEVALANAEYLCYASPNSSVVNNPDYSFNGNQYLYPDDAHKPKTQYFHDIDPEIRTYYERLWSEITR
ncbi:MAG: spermidine/putrescine ABC transporter substrate-binding protein [Clostridia bacterium]|nr:spermidine/putrescine ABC transporter substrate-binding protein [Clostridia bacterium]